jgi:hypothetical protein
MKSITSGMATRKTLVGSSYDGGDKNPPRKGVKKKHITYTPVKRKRNISMKINTLEVKEIPNAMDMDEHIEQPSCYVQRLLEMREINDSIMT